jgi:hypothetical protein
VASRGIIGTSIIIGGCIIIQYHAYSAKWHQAKYQDNIRTLKEDATNDASVL